MEERVLTMGPLLDEAGELMERGYHFSLVKEYERARIARSKWRIKEWDYYYVGNKERGIAFTVADNGYMWLVSSTFFDFRTASYVEKSFMGWFPFGKLGLPASSERGDVVFKRKGLSFEFLLEGDKRRLKVRIENFKGRELEADISLTPTSDNSMVIATPFRKRGHFYYNQKINCLSAKGFARLGNDAVEFKEDACGVLDWGRGVWTYKNTWYWASMNGRLNDGTPIGFNLGYGFGDTSAASENMLFVGKKAYKLLDVEFRIPKDEKGKDDFMRRWDIVDKAGQIKLSFTPVVNRHSDANALLIRSNQNQVFGAFSGTIATADGIFEIESQPGFAEKVYNRW